MTALTLTSVELRTHKANAHHLHPILLIGKAGLSPAVIKETDAALTAHNLIKIRVFSEERKARELLLHDLCDQLNAAPVQHIGKLLVIWRPSDDAAVAHGDQTRKAAVKTAAQHANSSRANHDLRPKIVTVVKPSRSRNHRPTVKKISLLGNQRITAGGLVKRSKKRTTSSSVKKRPV